MRHVAFSESFFFICSNLYIIMVLLSQSLIIASTYRQAPPERHVWVCVCVCVFASTCVISLGQVSVCLPVSLLWGECLPKECTTSDLSLTLIVQLIQPVPWGWVVLCPGKWEICAFLPLLLFCSVYLHMFLDANATWWKSIKDGKCIQSPELHGQNAGKQSY